MERGKFLSLLFLFRKSLAASQKRSDNGAFPAATKQASDTAFLTAVTERFAFCANEVRQAIDDTDKLGDAGTADLLTAVSQDLDKGLWMLEAHERQTG